DSCGGGSGLEEIPEAAFRAGEWPAPRRGRLLGSVEPAPEPDAGVPALPFALRCGRRAGPLARTSEHAAVVAGPRPSQLASLRGCPAFRFGPLAAALRLSARGDDLFASRALCRAERALEEPAPAGVSAAARRRQRRPRSPRSPVRHFLHRQRGAPRACAAVSVHA